LRATLVRCFSRAPVCHCFGRGLSSRADTQELKHYRAEMQAKLDAELGKEPAAHH